MCQNVKHKTACEIPVILVIPEIPIILMFQKLHLIFLNLLKNNCKIAFKISKIILHISPRGSKKESEHSDS